MPIQTDGAVSKLIFSVSEAAKVAHRSENWVRIRIDKGETFGGALNRVPGRRIEIYRIPFLTWLDQHSHTTPLISVTEAARIMGLDYSTVYYRIRRGESYGGAVVHETGRRIRIDADLLRAHFGDTEPDTAKAS
jgi:excisionase family DNA binding protein